MLKFSGYSYLIRGQPLKNWGFYGEKIAPNKSENKYYYAQRTTIAPPLSLRNYNTVDSQH